MAFNFPSPAASHDAPSWLARRRQQLADTMAERLLADVAAQPHGGRSAPADVLLAVLLATPVNLVTLSWFAGGGWFLLVGPWPVRVVGALLLLVGLATAPWPVRELSSPAYYVVPEDAPATYDLVRRVAASTGAPTPDAICLVSDYNAFAARLWRRRVLGLGAPLWVVAPPEARLAILGHELGHFRRDLGRVTWVHWARTTLDRWADVLSSRSAAYGFVWVLERLLLTPVQGAVAGYQLLLEWFVASRSRRGEHRADLDSLVAGTEGALRAMDVMLARDAAMATLRRTSLRGDSTALWPALRAEALVDDSEVRAGRRRSGERERNRTDDSHPRTSLRIRLIESRPFTPPAIVPDAATWAAIDAELEDALGWAASEAMGELAYSRHAACA